ncbi:helix-turn-helix domain-containing protein [Nocardia sp. NPDC046763]|uniref:helix-turn-helix domain-containing protein n=1 Tax=Nocardia sp. NPDC046763 TaxID=3155256 RepID=UPI00340594B2
MIARAPSDRLQRIPIRGSHWRARRLTMSPRTLQRRLQALGTNWRQEVELVRHENALRLIRDSDLPVQSVATRVGCTDARTLRRAIQRWTGHSTTEFRRQLLDPGHPAAEPLGVR